MIHLLYFSSTILFSALEFARASSHTSSSKSKFNFLPSSELSEVNFHNLDESSNVSTGIIAFVPYTKLKGVSRVMDWGVV